jgi:hypothetical protein
MARRDAPFSVEIPEAGADKPLWGKVGMVAAAGFVIGVAWPRLTSTRIAPSPPSENVSAPPVELAPYASATAPQVKTIAPAALGKSPPAGELKGPKTSSAAAAPVAPSAAPAPTGAVNPSPPVAALAPGTSPARALLPPMRASAAGPLVGTGFVLRCRDDQQDMTECGSFQFDGVAVPRIQAMARCPAARGASGKLSLGFDIDFRAKSVHLLLGKSTNLPRDTADALVHCAEPTFEAAALNGLAHDHRAYTVFYSARFGENAATASTPSTASAPEKPSAPASASAPATTDANSALIAWDVALLRESPKSGAIVERLLKGAKVKVLGHDGSWYHVQYGTIHGWVFREAIGL